MAKYIIKRLLLGALTVLAITFVMFVFQQLLPDKPYALLLNRPNQSQAVKDAIRAKFGVDEPLFVQYFKYLKNVSQPLWTWWGWPPQLPSPPDLGESNFLHGPVWEGITQRAKATGQLMITSYVVTLLIAVPLGILSAVKQYSKLDNTVTAFAFVGISLPNYWFGSVLIYLLADLPFQHNIGKIFPASGNGDGSIKDLAWHLVLPVIVLAVQSIAGYARYIRASMLEVLSQDYIRTARAKGLANRRVVIRHAFRNSLLPFITLLGLDIPTLFVGAIVTEVVFSWPGMGKLFVDSASGNDFPVLIGIALLLSIFVVLGNLIADVAYTWADPRISYEK